MSTTADPRTTSTGGSARIPGIVYLLSMVQFVMGTSEFMVAGMLTEIATELRVSVASASLVVTAFAATMIVGSPILALVTSRMSRRGVLVGTLALFSAGHVLGACADSLPILLGGRMISALAMGAFMAVASIVTVAAAPPGQASRAVGVMLSGFSLALAAGVPLGSWMGQAFGWRVPFAILGAITAALLFPLFRFVPARVEDYRPDRGIAGQIRSVLRRRVWILYSLAALLMGAAMTAYSFVSPYLLERVGMASGGVPLVLVGFGLGALVGNQIGGRYGDSAPRQALTVVAAALAAVLAALALFDSPVVAALLFVLLGVLAYTTGPIIFTQVFASAGPHKTLASALNPAAFNTGTAGATWLASLTVTTSLGYAGPPAVGVVIALSAVVPLIALRLVDRRHRRDGTTSVPTP